jgi:hypothetical protein
MPVLALEVIAINDTVWHSGCSSFSLSGIAL